MPTIDESRHPKALRPARVKHAAIKGLGSSRRWVVLTIEVNFAFTTQSRMVPVLVELHRTRGEA